MSKAETDEHGGAGGPGLVRTLLRDGDDAATLLALSDLGGDVKLAPPEASLVSLTRLNARGFIVTGFSVDGNGTTIIAELTEKGRDAIPVAREIVASKSAGVCK